MSKIYHEDIIRIDLANSGTVHRSFMSHTIGKGDNRENRFGVKVSFDGEPVNLSESTCTGLFIPPTGSPILISGTTYTQCSGDTAYVILPQACYAEEGQFTLSIKVSDGTITGTMRIVDGTVANTGSDDPVAPTGTVPTYQEILSVYDQMLAAKAGAVRYDIEQELTTAQKTQARDNIGMVLIEFTQISGNKYAMNVSTECEFVSLGNNKYSLVMHAD